MSIDSQLNAGGGSRKRRRKNTQKHKERIANVNKQMSKSLSRGINWNDGNDLKSKYKTNRAYRKENKFNFTC